MMMKSRKKARQITTLFHKLTKLRDEAIAKNDTVEAQRIEREIDAMGGRPEYQRASVLSTSFHSTSKWVLGQLAQNGWLYGIREETEQHQPQHQVKADGECTDEINKNEKKLRRLRYIPRRTTRILEVGAINTELLDAADPAAPAGEGPDTRKRYNICVRAIDIHSMVKGRIEECDFLDLPYIRRDVKERYDSIVCSMVINCVTTPEKRGEMLVKLYHHLRPGGLCFLTLPKFCLIKSAFLTPDLFEELLGPTGVGFEVVSTRCSPRVSFFVLRRPESSSGTESKGVNGSIKKFDLKWTKLKVRNKGPKFPNQFSVVLDKTLVLTGEMSRDEGRNDDDDSNNN
jgi:25S rRNA (adenine2142-N1)-methyltransferase